MIDRRGDPLLKVKIHRQLRSRAGRVSKSRARHARLAPLPFLTFHHGLHLCCQMMLSGDVWGAARGERRSLPAAEFQFAAGSGGGEGDGIWDPGTGPPCRDCLLWSDGL